MIRNADRLPCLQSPAVELLPIVPRTSFLEEVCVHIDECPFSS